MNTQTRPPADDAKPRGDKDIVQNERGEEMPTNKGTVERSSGDVKPKQQPPSPGIPASGE
ncbi:MAG: hypothetical protein JO205_09195 [Pseudolabrys sp.]|nr:hypothetical protein [Pseudolabrys sp.]